MSSRIVSTPSNLQVLYEDNHIIVVNKRVGDIVQGDKTGDTPLSDIVKSYLKAKYNKPGNVYLGVVHRLDRPTSGIVLFAKTSKALPRLNKLFADKKAQKTYWALIRNEMPNETGTLTHWLKKNPKNNKSTAFTKETKDSKKAILHYRVLKRLDNFYLVEIRLETGRHHQIRSQLASVGCPIKGDLKYGFNRSNSDGGISLHSRRIEFLHPVKKEKVNITAEPPNDKIWQDALLF